MKSGAINKDTVFCKSKYFKREKERLNDTSGKQYSTHGIIVKCDCKIEDDEKLRASILDVLTQMSIGGIQ